MLVNLPVVEFSIRQSESMQVHIHSFTEVLIHVDISGQPPIPLARKKNFHFGSFSGSKLLWLL
jgi:hypothetical protein